MDIVVNDKTTVADLFQSVYRDNYYDFQGVFAELISKYPQFESLIKEAWTKSSIYDIAYADFRAFFLDEEQQGSIFDGDFDY